MTGDRMADVNRAWPRFGLGAILFCASLGVRAEADIFKGADLKLGRGLIQEHRCNECHVRRVGGDGSAIYNPKGRISSPGALRGMVQYCATQLNLQWFPEDVTAAAAALNQDHYHFP
jgi:hypothetical protein